MWTPNLLNNLIGRATTQASSSPLLASGLLESGTALPKGHSVGSSGRFLRVFLVFTLVAGASVSIWWLVSDEPRADTPEVAVKTAEAPSTAEHREVGVAAAAGEESKPDMSVDEKVARIRRLTRKAMESYELLDFEAARAILDRCVARARAAGLAKERFMGDTYLYRGIVLSSAAHSDNGDLDAAHAAFVEAATIAPEIRIPPEYRSPKIQAAFDEARKTTLEADSSALPR